MAKTSSWLVLRTVVGTARIQVPSCMIRFLDKDSSAVSRADSSTSEYDELVKKFDIVNPSQNQLRTTWYRLSSEEREKYLPSIPREQSLSKRDQKKQKRTIEFIHSYRSYHLNKGSASDDSSPPDDEFMKKRNDVVTLPLLDVISGREKERYGLRYGVDRREERRSNTDKIIEITKEKNEELMRRISKDPAFQSNRSPEISQTRVVIRESHGQGSVLIVLCVLVLAIALWSVMELDVTSRLYCRRRENDDNNLEEAQPLWKKERRNGMVYANPSRYKKKKTITCKHCGDGRWQ